MIATGSAGLICAYHFDAGERRMLDTWTKVEAAQASGTGFLWIHVNGRLEAARQWLGQRSGLAPTVVEYLVDTFHRPHVQPHDGGILACLTDLKYDPGGAAPEDVQIHLHMDARLIVTTRQEPSLAINQLRRSLGGKFQPQDVSDILIDLLEEIGQSFRSAHEAVTVELDRIEDAILVGAIKDVRSDLGAVRRTVVMLRRKALTQRDAVARLRGGLATRVVGADRAGALEEAVDHVAATAEDFDVAQERAKVLQDELGARLNEDANNNLFFLSIVSSIMLPMTLVTGIFGMNVAGLPGTHDEMSFLWVSLFMIAVGGGFAWLLRYRHLI